MRHLIASALCLFLLPLEAQLDTLRFRRLTFDSTYSLIEEKGVFRFEVRPDDYVFNGNRSQMQSDTMKAHHYSFDFKVERYRHMEGAFFALVDWHLHPKIARENAYKGWGHRSVVAVILNKGRVEVGLRPMNKGRLKKVLRMPLDTGWMHFEMAVNWSSDPEKGSVRFKLQQDSVALDGIPTLYMDGKAPFFKLGIYKSFVHTDTAVVSYRNIRVDERPSTPDWVRPAKGAGKGYKKNGIDKGFDLERYERYRNRKK